MPLRAEALFRHLSQIRHVPLLRAVRGHYRYEVTGVGTWEVEVHDGRLTVRRLDAPSAACPAELTDGPSGRCYLGADEEDFVQMVLGQRNVTTTVMQGRARVDGDGELGLLGRHLFAAICEAVASARSAQEPRAQEELEAHP